MSRYCPRITKHSARLSKVQHMIPFGQAVSAWMFFLTFLKIQPLGWVLEPLNVFGLGLTWLGLSGFITVLYRNQSGTRVSWCFWVLRDGAISDRNLIERGGLSADLVTRARDEGICRVAERVGSCSSTPLLLPSLQIQFGSCCLFFLVFVETSNWFLKTLKNRIASSLPSQSTHVTVTSVPLHVPLLFFGNVSGCSGAEFPICVSAGFFLHPSISYKYSSLFRIFSIQLMVEAGGALTWS